MAEKTSSSKTGEKVPRRGINNPVTYVIVVLITVIIVVAFVFVSPGVGVGLLEGGNPGRIVFGSYKGRPIEYVPGNFFSQQLEQIAEEMRSEKSTAEDKKTDENIRDTWRQAFARAAFHTAIVSIMKDSGAGVSEKRIDEILVNNPRYMEGGEFSEKRYSQTPSSEKLVIRNDTRENILYYAYLQDIVGIRISKAETEFFKAMGRPERNFRFVSFGFDEFPESKVADYGRQNAEKFSQAKLSVITVISSRQDAEKIRTQAASGSSFSELAVSHSKDTFAKSGGDMGWRSFYELAGFGRSDNDIRDIFSLKPGETSRVIEGPAAEGQPQSYSIFRCDEAVRLPDFTKHDTIMTVRLYMNYFERGQIQDYMTEQAKAFKTKAESGSFMSASLSSGKPIKETGLFPVNYGDSQFLKRVAQNNASLAAAANRDTFFTTAFTLAEGAVSEPVILQDSVIVMQLLEERQPSANEQSFMDFYLPKIMGMYQEESLQRYIMNPADFKDNFETAFRRNFRFTGG